MRGLSVIDAVLIHAPLLYKMKRLGVVPLRDPSEAADVLVSVTSTLEVCFSPFVGGTERFAGATGDLTNIGEADLQAGTALR